ncbi:MAG: LLM class flavin-dependent oxidoreductase [Alphaproteobacteria bacterium]|jgi:alkanesulfonate monooxygenase SsuD/methylene tetrahydromethanopterin reductase-like flavin-dependent oxidoreductase (luciferase family)
MKFGLFYEHQNPKPWTEGSEARVFMESLEQIELADQIGIDHVWEVEHHFLEEYSHSSAPELFLAAASQRTKQIRLGHGIKLTAPNYNHPARIAEQLSTLDILSGGRVEWGTGESATLMEMEGFNIDPELKGAAWREGAEHAANMMAMTPYPGFKGEYFSMPCRNVVPKPVQKAHPPMWLACSRRDSILRAARNGMGALVFGFVEPEQAAEWVRDYYDIIKSKECKPLGWTVNPNIAAVSGFSLHQNEDQAIQRGLPGFRYFGYSLAHFTNFGSHQPTVTNIGANFDVVYDDLPDNAGRGGIGTPDQVRAHLKQYEDIGLDQLIFVQQVGRNQHDHITEGLELFSRTLLPEFKDRELTRQAQKQAEMQPYIDAALERKDRMPAIDPADIPIVTSAGKRREDEGAVDTTRGAYIDKTRGGAIPIPHANPHQQGAGDD